MTSRDESRERRWVAGHRRLSQLLCKAYEIEKSLLALVVEECGRRALPRPIDCCISDVVSDAIVDEDMRLVVCSLDECIDRVRAQIERRIHTPEKGRRYDIDLIDFVGWTVGDYSGHEGYRFEDFFKDGVYLGPDRHGIEPIVCMLVPVSPEGGAE